MLAKSEITGPLSAIVPSRLILAMGPFIAGTLLLSWNVSFNFWLFILCLFVLALADSSSSAINSVTDIYSDHINKPNRVLIKNPKYKKNVIFLFGLLLFLALFLSVFISLYLVLAVLLRIFFEVLYSVFKFKKIFCVNHFLVGVTYGAIPLFAAWAVFSINSSLFQIPVLFWFFFVLTIFLAPLKDIEDYYGDKQSGTKTFIVVFGLKKSQVGLPFLILILPVITLFFGLFYLNFGLVLASLFSLGCFSFLALFTKRKIDLVIQKANGMKWFTPIATLIGVVVEILFVLFLFI